MRDASGADDAEQPEHVDVLVVGAGVSGIGAAVTLTRERPGDAVLVLEARERVGGTWDLFRYPGVRSDSDMATFGYAFAPWPGEQVLADGPSIRTYLADVARRTGVDRLVRTGHRVVSAEFSSARGRWDVDVDVTGSRRRFTCRFLLGCTGYYRYDTGHRPRFAGEEEFTGAVVHPQEWPQDLDVTGRRVVVVGSGATAVTLVPQLARTAAHVTMLQRSPTWITSLPSRDPRSARRSHRRVRAQRIAAHWLTYRLARHAPRLTGRVLLRGVRRRLPPGFDVATHFTPRYAPWDQRLCVSADGDLFRALSDGSASVVTDALDSFTPTGVRTVSGRELPADVVVTATGLELQLFGGAALRVDGREVDPARALVHRGSMLSGVPNFAFVLGYTNSSWTLRVDLVARHVARVLGLLDASGAATVAPGPVPDGPTRPLLDLDSGYVHRAADRLPRQGTRDPWRLRQSYPHERWRFRRLPAGAGLVLGPPARQEVPARASVPVRGR
ncbi:flavin-containing monooxygenase [Kineococcus sp. SYSU DK004]|uniref:flavin-containing monooxygenase n=1 Tax=Kineococcus sp. SYSU DK004 TaxID=3383125 RepID=UPI003D7C7838